MCLQKLVNTAPENVPLPSYILPHVSTTVAWDNNNIHRIEETPSEGGTSHRVNGMIVQPKMYGPIPEPKITNVIKKTKQTFIEPREAFVLVYNARQRIGPVQRAHVAI